jgi:hypothetical protein
MCNPPSRCNCANFNSPLLDLDPTAAGHSLDVLQKHARASVEDFTSPLPCRTGNSSKSIVLRQRPRRPRASHRLSPNGRARPSLGCTHQFARRFSTSSQSSCSSSSQPLWSTQQFKCLNDIVNPYAQFIEHNQSIRSTRSRGVTTWSAALGRWLHRRCREARRGASLTLRRGATGAGAPTTGAWLRIWPPRWTGASQTDGSGMANQGRCGHQATTGGGRHSEAQGRGGLCLSAFDFNALSVRHRRVRWLEKKIN